MTMQPQPQQPQPRRTSNTTVVVWVIVAIVFGPCVLAILLCLGTTLTGGLGSIFH